MYAISIDSNNRVTCVYDTNVFVDEGVELFEITKQDVIDISKTIDLNDWIYLDSKVIYSPISPISTANTVAPVAPVF